MVIEAQLKKVLNQLSPLYLSIKNESYMHAVPKDSETHFNVTVVCSEFDGLSRVKQHQKVYEKTKPLMQQGLHALALHTFTPAEWEKNNITPASPDCLGGSKNDTKP